jgi:putative NIF3 family GTP cyclohydrolase 1 type 2
MRERDAISRIAGGKSRGRTRQTGPNLVRPNRSNTMSELSRRHMMAGTGAVLTMGAHAAATLTAGDVIARIKAHVGVPWQSETVDHFIAGDESTPVNGIATAMMATFDVVKAVVASGKNMLITHEPTFWSHPDDVSQLQSNPLYQEKLDYIRQHNLAIFHFHDHWHALKPRDGIAVGMMNRLGWTSYVDQDNPQAFTLPPTTLLKLTQTLRQKLNAHDMRAIGKPQMPVRRVKSSWGYTMKAGGMALLDGDTDVLLVGETWEWELQEYVHDLVSAGRNKALVVIGHINSEQWGMQYCAEWLKPFVPEVPVQFIEMKEPYWAPRA